MNFKASTKHTFPIVNENEIQRKTVQFIQFAINSDTDHVRHFSLCLLIDMCRCEFPTNSIRDMLTCYTRFNEEYLPNDTISSELRRLQLYTAVVIKINHCIWLESHNKAIRDYCHNNNFTHLYETIFTRNILIDVMYPPLESLPYFRMRTSSKHFPRILVDNKGNVYDPFGLKQNDLKYDLNLNLMTEINTGFKFYVPLHDGNVSLCEFIQKRCLLGLYYGKLPVRLKLSKQIVEAFDLVWHVKHQNKMYSINWHTQQFKFDNQHTLFINLNDKNFQLNNQQFIFQDS